MTGYFEGLIAAGKCTACAGSGRVIRFVPYEDEFPCSVCGGDGRHPPAEWRVRPSFWTRFRLRWWPWDGVRPLGRLHIRQMRRRRIR